MFSNENVTKVSELDPHGILLQLEAQLGYDYCYGETNATRRVQFTIDGVDAILNEITFGPPEPYWHMWIQHGGYCYVFFFAYNQADLQTIDSSEAIAVAILSTFTFGTPPPPTP